MGVSRGKIPDNNMRIFPGISKKRPDDTAEPPGFRHFFCKSDAKAVRKNGKFAVIPLRRGPELSAPRPAQSSQ